MNIFLVYFIKQNIYILNAESLTIIGMQIKKKFFFNLTQRIEEKRASQA